MVLLLQKGYYATFSILLVNEKKANTEKVCIQRTLIIKAKLNIWKKKKSYEGTEANFTDYMTQQFI